MNKNFNLPSDFYTTMFDYGVFTPLNEVSPTSINSWIQRNLSLEGDSPENYTAIGDVVEAVLKKGLHGDEAFHSYVREEDKTHKSSNWVTYLTFIGNMGYNERIGNNTKDIDEMFHYKDALLNDPTEICGSNVSYPVLVSRIFEQDSEMQQMLARRTFSYFPELHFDLQAWKKSLAFASNTIDTQPTPTVEDFCHNVSFKYNELTSHNCEHLAVLPSLHACLSEVNGQNVSPEEFKHACKAIASAPLLACSYCEKDKQLLHAYVNEYSVESPDVDYSIDPKTHVDAYAAYEKEFGKVQEPSPEITDEDVVRHMQTTTKEYADAISKLVKEPPTSASIGGITMLSIRAVQNNMPKEELIKNLTNKDGEITVEAIFEQIREFDRDNISKLQNPNTISM